MTRTFDIRALLCLAFLCTSGTTVRAQGHTGSLLIFPEYDQATGTLLTVTNTSSAVPANLETQWVYVNGASCVPSDPIIEPFTPNDQLSVVSSAHFSGAGPGYVYAYAADAATHRPMSFNHLIGASIRFDGLTATEYAIDPVVFRAIGPEGAPTDLDNDGRRDFDGSEYELCPDRISIPRFLGQGPTISSDLVLIDMTGGTAAATDVRFLVFNDNSEPFSQLLEFHCWRKTSLISISGLFDNTFLQGTSDNPSEIIGNPAQESGWMEIDGDVAFTPTATIDNPPVLAFLVDRIQNGAVGGSPFAVGAQAGGSVPPPIPPVQPPDCPSANSLSLWPPNHQYVVIDLNQAAGVTDPGGLPISIAITSITQDEPIDAQGGGDGNTVCDGTGVGTSVARIRAEREGGSNGRVYKVNYTATNSAGLSCTNALTVTVPHDQSGAAAIDDGQTVNSSIGCP